MSDMLLFSVDAESDWGEPIAKKFGVRGYPTMVILNSDGTVRDQIGGYMPPEPFIKEVKRIQSGAGTVDALRKKVAEHPKDIAAIFELAQKLKEMGDDAGYQEQVAAIRKLDPEAKSEAMQLIGLDDVLSEIDGRNPDATALVAYLANATNPTVLYQGNTILARIYFWQLKNTEGGDADAIRANGIAAYHAQWKHCPAEERAQTGNAIAWSLWEMRDDIGDADKAFALEVARKAAALAPEDASILDTLACCQFMNGDLEGANATIDRAIELDPENSDWRDRKKLFGART